MRVACRLSLVACLCFVCPTWQRLSTAANLTARPTAAAPVTLCSPPPPTQAGTYLTPLTTLQQLADAYLSWLPGAILISVQSHPLSLYLALFLSLSRSGVRRTPPPLCMAFGCSFACENVAISFRKNWFSVVLATTLTRAASLIILYEFFITAAAIEILTFSCRTG